MKITKNQLRRIIKEQMIGDTASLARAALSDFDAAIQDQELSLRDYEAEGDIDMIHQIEQDVDQLTAIRNDTEQELNSGRPPSDNLKNSMSILDTSIRELIPQDIYYWVFPELLEARRVIGSIVKSVVND